MIQAKGRMELIGSDIDGINVGDSSLEENLGKSSGRGSDIETLFLIKFRYQSSLLEYIQESFELLSTPSHPVDPSILDELESITQRDIHR